MFNFQSGFTQFGAINRYPCCLFTCALVFEELASSFLLAGISPLLAIGDKLGKKTICQVIVDKSS
ncbi:MAG: hypothetical protein QNJ65_00140 [Xenococcaceae cyanobacterium MO_234.B1]|nr:hypothetical protein [Xenococcaceae cyanobacterium MO_234.B1]